MKWLLTYPEDGPSIAFYEAFARRCGAEPVLLSDRWVAPDDLSPFDALLLSGGGDVDPARYGAETRHPCTYDVIPERDELETRLIDAFLARSRPIFGICRGIQILNVHFGGGLIQHVPDRWPEAVESHRQKDRYDAMHPLRIDPGTRLGAALSDVRESNSAHHQAVDPARIGSGLRIAAFSAAGVIEALESCSEDPPISAVQWHPERLPAEHPAAGALAAHWRAIASGK